MIHLNSIDEIIKNYENKILVLYFSSTDKINNEYLSLETKYKTINFSVIFNSEELTDFFEIDTIPTIIILDNHKEVLRTMFIDEIKNYFGEYEQDNNYTIIDFYADWCNPCRKIAPLYDELSVLYKKINFTKINIDDSPEIAEEFNIESIPTFVILNNDTEIYRCQDFYKLSKFIETLN